MPHHLLKVSIVSSILTLEKIEAALGGRSVSGYSLGHIRENGSLCKQSMWMQECTVGSEVLEEAVDEVLGWLAPALIQLKSFDNEVVCKLFCEIRGDIGRDSFVVNPPLARKLADIGAQLFLDVNWDSQKSN